jgi:hypothetical protein
MDNKGLNRLRVWLTLNSRLLQVGRETRSKRKDVRDLMIMQHIAQTFKGSSTSDHLSERTEKGRRLGLHDRAISRLMIRMQESLVWVAHGGDWRRGCEVPQFRHDSQIVHEPQVMNHCGPSYASCESGGSRTSVGP